MPRRLQALHVSQYRLQGQGQHSPQPPALAYLLLGQTCSFQATLHGWPLRQRLGSLHQHLAPCFRPHPLPGQPASAQPPWQPLSLLLALWHLRAVSLRWLLVRLWELGRLCHPSSWPLQKPPPRRPVVRPCQLIHVRAA